MNDINIEEALSYINPSNLEYQEWVNIGMALKESGYDVAVWDTWSQADHRYKSGECERKWRTFTGNSNPVTAGTIIEMARQNGFSPVNRGYALSWDDEINLDAKPDLSWTESEEVDIKTNISPKYEVLKYLNTVFQPDDKVNFVFESWQDSDGKYKPRSRGVTKTREELIAGVEKHGDDLGAVFGDYKEAAGAWIRFNPMDGNGVKNENVAEFRYALIECDDLDIGTQKAILKEMGVPIIILLFSGKKSLHALVKVDAVNMADYRQKVEELYKICKYYKLTVDTQNKNPSRLSRIPGVKRGDNWQYIVDTNINTNKTFDEWLDQIKSDIDNLPEIESLSLNNLPELAPAIIDGVLREGHKMILTGPSKAGKSFALMQLALAIAEGSRWMQKWRCRQGRVLYVNLEIDANSFKHRFLDIYNRLELKPSNNIDIWNLRGRAVPMDKLAPSLIRRAKKEKYSTIIIDPIYKVITGDENSAGDMARFCNEFDKISSEIGCAVIFCHHHSKSALEKSAMNRGSGSGVFSRDPDAILDMVEIDPRDCGVTIEGTAWRFEGTLREFKSFDPFEIEFKYPIHVVRDDLAEAGLKHGADAQVKAARGRATQQERKLERQERLIDAFENLVQIQGNPTIEELADYFDGERGFGERNIRKWIDKDIDELTIRNGVVVKAFTAGEF